MKRRLVQEPVIKNNNPSGSVGEFIELLKGFPPDAQFTIDGEVSINGIENTDGELKDYSIKSRNNELTNPSLDTIIDDTKKYDKNDVLYHHMFGEKEITNAVRAKLSEDLLSDDIMNPYPSQIEYENQNLLVKQQEMFDEIRQKNTIVVENLAELYRRQLAALLEYNTQCLSNMVTTNNKIMVTVLENWNDTHKGE